MIGRWRIVRRDVWPLLRLLSVGVAWGAPLTLAGFANTNPGVARHPQLARLLEPLATVSILLVPLLAVAGMTLIWRLSDRPPRLNTASVLAFICLAGLPLILGAIESALMPLFALLLLEAGDPEGTVFMGLAVVGSLPALLAVLEITLALFAGAVVTFLTLWRYRAWLAPLWLAAWLSVAAFVWLAGRQTADTGKDLGGGLFVALLSAALLATSLAAPFVFAALSARREASHLTPGGEA